MHSGRLEIFRMKAYFDFRFRVRQFLFNQRCLTSFSAPKSLQLTIFPLRQVLLYFKGKNV
jgi:hypothetical protein